MIRLTVVAQHFVAHPMVIARALPDSPATPKTSKHDFNTTKHNPLILIVVLLLLLLILLRFLVIRLRFLVIRWTVVAQNVVAHPMVLARAFPDSFETLKTANNDFKQKTF